MPLLGFVLTGRFVLILIDWPAPCGTEPMVVEAACISALAWGRSAWKAG